MTCWNNTNHASGVAKPQGLLDKQVCYLFEIYTLNHPKAGTLKSLPLIFFAAYFHHHYFVIIRIVMTNLLIPPTGRRLLNEFFLVFIRGLFQISFDFRIIHQLIDSVGFFKSVVHSEIDIRSKTQL